MSIRVTIPRCGHGHAPPHVGTNERASFSGKLELALVPTRIVVMSPEKLVGSLAPAWGGRDRTVAVTVPGHPHCYHTVLQ